MLVVNTLPFGKTEQGRRIKAFPSDGDEKRASGHVSTGKRAVGLALSLPLHLSLYPLFTQHNEA